MEKTTNIVHKTHYCQDANLSMVTTIRLNDECKNGHADFSVTCSAREKYNGRRYDSFCGCCHDEILKRHPELKIFTDLHLSDSNGAPMYALENGFYHAWDERKTKKERECITCEYLRCSKQEYSALTAIKEKLYFHYMIDTLELPKRWKKEAQEAIRKLEKMSGKKWDRSFKWARKQYEEQSKEDKKEIMRRVKAGYYSNKEMNRREKERQHAEYMAQIAKVEESRKNTIEEENRDALVKKFVIGKVYYITSNTKRTDLKLNSKNFIYYTHSNTVCFNWCSYEAQIDRDAFHVFCDAITEKELQELPQGITFQIKECDKVVDTFKRN